VRIRMKEAGFEYLKQPKHEHKFEP